jgi:DNA primase
MTRRFSAQQLSYLRNQIPIERVIKIFLSLHTDSRSGKLSFACPVCHGSNTSINAKHNLARCFDCRQNFNPIEIVMHHLQISFVDSVKWLKQRNRKPVAEDTPSHGSQKRQPVSIGNILSEILPNFDAEKTTNPSLSSITQRISNLEKSVKQLYRLIEELRSLVY